MQEFVQTQINRALNESSEIMGKAYANPSSLNAILESLIKNLESVRLVEAEMPSKEYQKDLDKLLKLLKGVVDGSSDDFDVVYDADNPSDQVRGSVELLFSSTESKTETLRYIKIVVQKLAARTNFKFILVRPHTDNHFGGKSLKTNTLRAFYMAIVEYIGKV